jgi:GNAT superfamily N-acetyltransferase
VYFGDFSGHDGQNLISLERMLILSNPRHGLPRRRDVAAKFQQGDLNKLLPRPEPLKLNHKTAMLRIKQALGESAISQVRELFREYAKSPDVSPCWQDFDRELASLPDQYSPPEGRLLLAHRVGPDKNESLAGCVAMHKLEEGICEMKRLYVRPEFRGEGAGRELAKALIAEALSIGYGRMRLDTLPIMREAQQLYKMLGFREIPAYQKNPTPGALYFELDLR